MVELATTIWADGPSSNPYEPSKAQIREWGTWVEGVIGAFIANGGLIYTSKASLDADLAHAAHSSAWVIGDATAGNNGVYMKVGASGAGSWTRVADLPFSFIIAADIGTGTPNAIQATTSIPVSGSALVWTNIFEANTASPVTISFNGGAPLTVKTNSGNNIAAGGLVAGMIVMGIASGTTFRLISDQASAAVVAAAEAALAEFQKYYLGAYAADPTTDPNGNPLVAGAWYFNTTSNTSRIYNGSVFSPVPGMDPYASDAEATAATATNRIMSPARVKKAIETVSLTLDLMNNAEALAAIINRTGLTPQMLGAQAGDTNHRSFIQAAYDRLKANGGGTLWLPSTFTWKLGSGLTFNNGATLDQKINVRGLGPSTRVEYSPTTGTAIAIGDGTNPVGYLSVEDLYIVSTGTRTAGWDIEIKKGSKVRVRGIRTDGSFAGINCEYVNAIELVDTTINSLLSGGSGYRFYANPSVGRCDEMYVENITVQGRNKGIQGFVIYGAVNVLKGDRVYLLGVDRGLDMDSDASGTVPFNIRLRQFEVDRAISNAVVLTKGKDITFDEPDIANTSGAAAEPPGAAQGGNDGDVFTAGNGVSMLRVKNGRLGNGRQRGMNIGASDVMVENMKFHDLSKQTGAPGPHPMIYLDANARRVDIIRNRFFGFSRSTYCFQGESAAVGTVDGNYYTGMVNGFSSYGGSSIVFNNNRSF
ncbi:hypothetical protein [Ensifer adhaerens]|uniref:hypothetical protein n=1 Tax=Ensifer adhaerens TaxID=106592 RepID=UPI0015C40B1B|nr:hypothetical protein [Ensifer adhaerens]